MQNSPHRLIRALLRQPVDKTPIWIMRQAGRYLPEYREIRAQVKGFMALCQNPELACEVTLQPLRRFELDAAILFSDILTIPDAMGLGLTFTPGEGPSFAKPIRRLSDLKKLGVPDPEQDLGYVMATVRACQQQLAGSKPLIGFAGSPWTLACYMVEGKSSKDFLAIRGLCYQDPKFLHQLLTLLTHAVSDYLNAQIKAGVDCVMLFDTWGGILSTPHFQQFSLQYLVQIVHNLQHTDAERKIPVIIFCKQAGLWLEDIAMSGCDAVGIDWHVDLAQARARIGDKVALQGNLDPACLYASHEQIQQEVTRILHSYGRGTGHVFNLGHGITPDIDPAKVKTLVDAVHSLSENKTGSDENMQQYI